MCKTKRDVLNLLTYKAVTTKRCQMEALRDGISGGDDFMLGEVTAYVSTIAAISGTDVREVQRLIDETASAFVRLFDLIYDREEG